MLISTRHNDDVGCLKEITVRTSIFPLQRDWVKVVHYLPQFVLSAFPKQFLQKAYSAGVDQAKCDYMDAGMGVPCDNHTVYSAASKLEKEIERRKLEKIPIDPTRCNLNSAMYISELVSDAPPQRL